MTNLNQITYNQEFFVELLASEKQFFIEVGSTLKDHKENVFQIKNVDMSYRQYTLLGAHGEKHMESMMNIDRLHNLLDFGKTTMLSGEVVVEEIIAQNNDIKVTFFQEKYEVSFNYNPAIVEEVKKITGRKFDGQNKKWIIPASSQDEIINFVENFMSRNISQEKYNEILTIEGLASTPNYPTAWNHIKREGVWILTEKLSRSYLGSRENYTSSRKNADIIYSDSEQPESLTEGTLLVVADGSYKNFHHYYYRKDNDGWKYLGEDLL